MLVALFSARLVDELGGFLPAGTFESFRTELGLDYARATAVLVAAAPGAIAGTVSSVAADHYSRRVIAAGGAFGFSAALVGFACGRHFGVLLAASFLLGVSATALVDASELALIDLSGDAVRANLARAYAVSTVGDLLGPALLVLVAATGFGWRVSFGIAAVIAAAYGVWLASLRLPPPERHEHLGGMRDGLRDVLRIPAVWYLGAAAALVGPLDEPFLAFLIAKLQRVDGLSVGWATAVATCSIVGALAAFVRSPHLGEPSVTRNALLLAAGAAAAGLLPWPPVVAGASFALGIGLARGWLALKVRVVALVPQRVGTVKAVVSAIEFVGFLLPLAAGTIADRFGLRAALGCYVLFAAGFLALGRQASRARAI